MGSYRILMIDDETEYTSLTKMYLEEAAGFEVQVVNRGSHGLAIVKDYKPDLILLDISMPDLSGFDVAQSLRADPESKSIPVLFFTGADDAMERVPEALKDYPCLTKPTSGEHLLEFIRKYLPEKS